jgi:hypothetical protein
VFVSYVRKNDSIPRLKGTIMTIARRILSVAAPFALLGLTACATGFPAQVERFQAMPAPAGQSFVVQAADRDKAGSLEFAQYADLVRRGLVAEGYSEASSPAQATMVATLDYGVDNGRERVEATPDPFGPPFGFGHPYYSRFGYFGYRRSPFFWGWDYPFPAYDVRSYTVYTSFLDLDIRRTADGQSLFEGHAQARSGTNALPVLVPNLVEAMFTGFPGNSGETLRITVMPEQQRRQSRPGS